MKIILYIFGALFTLVILMAFVGAMLPRAHVATRSKEFRKKPMELYAAARDFATQASWRSGLNSVELLPPRDGRVCFREVSQRRAMTYVVLQDDPGHKLVFKIVDEGLPFGGTWTIEFTPAGEGASVRITENGEVKNGLFRFLSRFVFGYTASMDAYLRDLGKKFGEASTPQP